MAPGGGSPLDTYPSYVAGQYIQWLTGENPADYAAVDPNLPVRAYNPYNMRDLLRNTFLAGNPYDSAFAFDPTELLDASQVPITAALAAATAIEPVTDWDTFAEAALAKLPDVVIGDSTVEAEVTAYRVASELDYIRGLNSVMGGLVEINAVGGSVSAMALANARARYEMDIDSFRSRLLVNTSKDRMLFVVQSISDMASMMTARVGALQSGAQLQAEVNRVATVANREWLEQELSNEIDRLRWDLDLFKFGGQSLSSITGVATAERGLSRTASAIGGAITGGTQLAALGAQAGKGPAIALGIIGAFLGGYGGYATA